MQLRPMLRLEGVKGNWNRLTAPNSSAADKDEKAKLLRGSL